MNTRGPSEAEVSSAAATSGPHETATLSVAVSEPALVAESVLPAGVRTIVVGAIRGESVRIPYDAARERVAAENLRANRPGESRGPSTSDL